MAFIKTHFACPDQSGCGSSDGASLDDRGTIHCFVCKRNFNGGDATLPPSPDEQKPTPKPSFSAVENLLVTGEYLGCPERGITPETAKFYKALHTKDKTYYGYYGKDSPMQAVAVKMRYPDKRFPWVGDSKAALLFGQQNFASGGKYLTLTEGECLLPSTEVLTPSGWVRLDEWDGQAVMGGQGHWEPVIAKVMKQYEGDLLQFVSGSYRLTTTPDHNMVRVRPDGVWTKAPAGSTAHKHLPLPRVPAESITATGSTHARLQVMLSADFTFREKGDLLANFSRERKIIRCRDLLDRAGIKYAMNVQPSTGKTAFFIHRGHGLSVSKLFDYARDLPHARDIIEEVVHWDGNVVPNRAQVEYSTKEHHNAKFIQTCAHLCGYTSTIIPRSNQYGKWFKVSILLNKKTSSTQKGWERVPYCGYVGCLQVPSGTLLVREQDSVSVTGNCDAMAAYQLCGSKYPVVSIQNGAQAALASCKAAYEWIDSFDNIVLSFDADKAGQDAAREVAQLFGGKASIMKHPPGIKDACDYYIQKRAAEWSNAWWRAEKYTPDGIVSGESLRELLKTPVSAPTLLYPWRGLNRMLRGIRDAELVTWCAGSGVGKTSLLREIIYYTLASTDRKVGLAFLEETPERTMRGIAGLHLNKPIHLDGIDYSASEVDAAFDGLGLGHRTQFWEHWGSSQIDNVISRLKYFVKAMGCSLVILDHISIVVSGDASQNERQVIDELMTRLRTEVVQQTHCSLHIVSHLTRPDGKPLENGAPVHLGLLRGSGAIAQLSDVVIGAERNSQAEDTLEKNTLKIRVLKSRITGKTGVATHLLYDETSGRLQELEETI